MQSEDTMKAPEHSRRWIARIRGAAISSLLTLAISLPGMLWLAATKTEAAKQSLQKLEERQAADHETLTRLAALMQRMVDDHDKQLALHAEAISRLKLDVVPRQEHESKWASDAIWKSEIKQDLREMRADEKEILSHVKK